MSLVVVLAAWTAFALLRSTPKPELVTTTNIPHVLSGKRFSVSTASGVQDAISVNGIGTVAASTDQTPQPIGSLTKMMSAMVILQDHPLTVGENGPNIVITASDVAQYQLDKSEGDSVVKIRAGETLTELQALEGVLIPSGDNVAQLLAIWDAGSEGAFVARMNALAVSMGMRQTIYAGVSGVDSASVSTADNQLRLIEQAMKNPVFAGIVAMAQVTLPVAGIIYNVNADLGTDGIDGVKTGWIPQSGGCLAFSAEQRIKSKNVVIFGVLLGQGGVSPIPDALRHSKQLVKDVESKVQVDSVNANSIIANYDASDGQIIPIVTMSQMSVMGLSGSRVHVTVHLTRHIGKRLESNTTIGTVAVSIGLAHARSEIRTASSITGSALWWRFTHL